MYQYEFFSNYEDACGLHGEYDSINTEVAPGLLQVFVKDDQALEKLLELEECFGIEPIYVHRRTEGEYHIYDNIEGDFID